MYCGLSNGDIRSYDYRESPEAGETGEFCQHRGPVRALSCHPLHSLLASGGDDTEVIVWDLSSGRTRVRLRGKGCIRNALSKILV